MTVWMEVTTDELSLPVAVAGSKYELAKMCGVKTTAIEQGISQFKRGIRKEKYVRVEVEDDA